LTSFSTLLMIPVLRPYGLRSLSRLSAAAVIQHSNFTRWKMCCFLRSSKRGFLPKFSLWLPKSWFFYLFHWLVTVMWLIVNLHSVIWVTVSLLVKPKSFRAEIWPTISLGVSQIDYVSIFLKVSIHKINYAKSRVNLIYKLLKPR
jgi:hypothetical protein